MLKNFWYAVEFSRDVTEKPKRLRVLGQDLVAYRPAAGAPAVVMSDLCVHRGGALSDGWVRDGCIVCPYHGWSYRTDGSCAGIPANGPGATIPRRARVDSYPSVERYGFVWTFLGDLPEGERPPLPDFPEFNDPSYRAVTGEFHWKANWDRVVENAMDVAHPPFVHPTSFGNAEKPEVPVYEPDMHEWGGKYEVVLEARRPRGLWRLLARKGRPGVPAVAGFHMPSITFLEVTLPMGKQILIDSNIPVDEGTTITKWLQLRTFFTGKWADNDARRRVTEVFLQDQRVVENQRPELLPFDLRDELHVRSDAMAIAYRKMRQRFVALGWDVEAHQFDSGTPRGRVTVIPSPARRENPELAEAWVMKEVASRPAGAWLGSGGASRDDCHFVVDGEAPI